MSARKVSKKDVRNDPKLWFKPYCSKCQIIFDDYNEYIDHCRNEHWNKGVEVYG